MSGDTSLNVAVIIGSTRHDRFGPTPAGWITECARQHGDLNVDVIDLKDAALPDTLAGDDENAPVPEAVQALAPRLAQAHAFVVVTPVYNRSFPAPLKTAIDWFYEEWQAKPVGFVSYGGAGGGLHAVEQLRSVFNELHAPTIRNTVSIANYWDCVDERGDAIDPQSLDRSAKSFFDQLTWWAHALREARAARAYPA